VKDFQLLDWRSASGLPYDIFLKNQEELAGRRLRGEIPDTVVLANHPPTITLGVGRLREQLAAIRPLPRIYLSLSDETVLWDMSREYLQKHFGIALIRTKRGGKVWYHDTGVLHWYVIAETSPHFPAQTVHRLEETFYRALVALGLPVRRIPERHERGAHSYLGVWSGEKKLAAIGVRVTAQGGRWVSQFGVALNVSPDQKGLRLIDPCGITGKDATSIAEIARPDRMPTEESIVYALTDAFSEVFEATWAKDQEKKVAGYA